MTAPAELNICLGVAVEETRSLVSRDRDEGFLRWPRDVYILQNTHTKHRTFTLWPEQMDTRCPAVYFTHHCSLLGSHTPPPRALAVGLQPPNFPKSEVPRSLSTGDWVDQHKKSKAGEEGAWVLLAPHSRDRQCPERGHPTSCLRCETTGREQWLGAQILTSGGREGHPTPGGAHLLV